ncbi:MAG: transglutaminase domain-containing protein [Cyclobacteriaceae bacterium]
MKNIFVIILFCACLGFSCQRPAFHQVEVDNPPFRKNIVFESFEDLSSPMFQALREKYQLDTVFHGEKDEFKRVLLLRDWIRTVIEIDNSGKNYPGEGQAEGILDAALQGHGFHCGHYMIVQNAVMNAYGYVTRCIGAGEGADDGLEIHHGLNEVWINSFSKWVLSDAKYNYHFEKNGIPLSALEVRDAYLKNRAADIVVMKGPDRIPTPFDKDQQNRSTELYARIYTFLEWEMYNNRYTKWPDVESYLVMLNDDYFKNHTWIWNGKPHWAYGKEYMNLIEDRGLIEWTPNTLSSSVEITGDSANIKLASTTPNFKTSQMRRLPDTTWENVTDKVSVKLENGINELEFRTVNLANVSGPPHKVIIEN